MQDLDRNALDRHITGNWGENQFRHVELTRDDLEVVWNDDWEVGDHTKEFDTYDHNPDRCERAAVFGPNGECLASLGCIDDATPEYRKQIEQELLDEAMDALYD